MTDDDEPKVVRLRPKRTIEKFKSAIEPEDLANIVSLASGGEPIDDIKSKVTGEIIEELECLISRVRDGQICAIGIAYLDVNLFATTYYHFYKAHITLIGSLMQLIGRINKEE
jgi:hypothetical protein